MLKHQEAQETKPAWTYTQTTGEVEEISTPSDTASSTYIQSTKIPSVTTLKTNFWNQYGGPFSVILLAVVLGFILGDLYHPFALLWARKDAEGEKLLFKIAPQLSQSLIQSIVFAVGSGVGIWQWNRTYNQKQEELRQKEKDITLKEREITNKASEFVDKQETDALVQARKELQDQFVDIQNRLASAEDILRANAVLRLAEFAKQQRPRNTHDKQKEAILPFTELNFPYFLPAIALLAVAVRMEGRNDLRSNIANSVDDLVRFAAQKENDPIHTSILRELANANTESFRVFLNTVIHYHGLVPSDAKDVRVMPGEFLNKLTSFVPIRAALNNGKYYWIDIILRDLFNNQRYQADLQIFLSMNFKLTEEQRAGQQEDVLKKVQEVAIRFEDTKDRLAFALNELGAKLDADSRAKLTFLEGQFLAGHTFKYLSGMPLAQANLSATVLTGSTIGTPMKVGADLSRADLTGAKFYEAIMYRANLSGAKLHRADLTNVNLTGADLSGADLSEAVLNKTWLTNANLSLVDLTGATLTRLSLNGATIYGIHYNDGATNLAMELTSHSNDLPSGLQMHLIPKSDDQADLDADLRTEALCTLLKERYPDAYAALARECLDEWEDYKKRRASKGILISYIE